jgi:hypothetical protein
VNAGCCTHTSRRHHGACKVYVACCIRSSSACQASVAARRVSWIDYMPRSTRSSSISGAHVFQSPLANAQFAGSGSEKNEQMPDRVSGCYLNGNTSLVALEAGAARARRASVASIGSGACYKPIAQTYGFGMVGGIFGCKKRVPPTRPGDALWRGALSKGPPRGHWSVAPRPFDRRGHGPLRWWAPGAGKSVTFRRRGVTFGRRGVTFGRRGVTFGRRGA